MYSDEFLYSKVSKAIPLPHATLQYVHYVDMKIEVSCLLFSLFTFAILFPPDPKLPFYHLQPLTTTIANKINNTYYFLCEQHIIK